MLLLLGASFAFSAYRNGAGAPRFSLVVALIQLAGSALFTYMLIFNAELGTEGAGLGATLAALLALAIHAILAKWIAPVPGFLATRPSLSGIRLILRIGLPVGLQQSFVYIGTAIYLAIVGLLGTGEVAAMNVVSNIMLLAILPAAGMGIAAATLVGAALGRGDAVDARRWGWEVATLGALAIVAFSLIVVAAPQNVLNLFIADNTTIELAAAPLRVMALGMSIDAFGRILGFALRGAGATRLVTLVAFGLQWGVQLPLIWLMGVHFGFGLFGMSVCRLLLFAVEAAIVATLWRNGLWIGGAINHSGSTIISTARPRP
jgi:MATE family multidrug resistance protein